MSTRSFIAYENNLGEVDCIYCHWDGYLRHVGQILQNHYATKDRAKALISLGDLSTLGPILEQSEFIKHFGFDNGFDYAQNGKEKLDKEFHALPENVRLMIQHSEYDHCIAYYRDRAKFLTQKEQKRSMGCVLKKPQIQHFDSEKDFYASLKDNWAIEFVYLFKKGKWHAHFDECEYIDDSEKQFDGLLSTALRKFNED